jgi:hypothetical protein
MPYPGKMGGRGVEKREKRPWKLLTTGLGRTNIGANQ